MKILVCAAVCGMASNAWALISWSNPSGTAISFSWSGGGSDTALFGSPTIIGDSFVFFPSQFRAESTNGVADSTYDRLEVDLTALAGKNITGIRITEYGDYGILSSGSVQVSGGLFFTNIGNTGTGIIATASLASNPVSPITSGSGNWTATATISGLDWTKAKFIMNNNLQATSAAGSTSFIEKKVGQAAVVITIIPEPATIALLALGGILFIRKK